MKLIIQIPCYNEEKTLPQTIYDLPKYIDGVDEIEYLIINDGSSDRTVEIAEQCGVHHIVNFKQNKGLAKGFMAGIDACLRLGADIIVNTDADNQYNGGDVAKLVQPIISEQADIVIGERPVDDTPHWSPLKKKLQHMGSLVVRIASGTSIPDAPSGFRAYSREAAMQINVTNAYTYTLETIIQAGMNKVPMSSVPIRTNAETRKSRLFSSMYGYVKRSASVIVRSYVMYRPLKVLGTVGTLVFLPGLLIGLRFLWFFINGYSSGHIQSLILSSLLMMLGVLIFVCGVLSDLIASNRKILEDIQYNIRKMKYDGVKQNDGEGSLK